MAPAPLLQGVRLPPARLQAPGRAHEHLARTLERGLFDMLFFADAYSLHEAYGGSTDATIRYAVQYPRLDPFTWSRRWPGPPDTSASG